MKISIKKLLLIALSLFLTIESGNTTQRRLKPKLRRKKGKIATIFKTDDLQKVAQEVATINAEMQTSQEKEATKTELEQRMAALQNEINKGIQEAKTIGQDLKDQPHYITYNEALDIIKSKKELSKLKSSSWTTSAIIKPFTQTYRLFLRWWNQKEYATMLEKERKSLEHELNVQAHNNLMLLYVALDLEFKQAGLNTDHMFKKDNFYNITTHAFEGGALLATDIRMSKEFQDLLNNLSNLIISMLGNDLIRKNVSFEAIQSIYTMTQVIKEAQTIQAKNIALVFKKSSAHLVYPIIAESAGFTAIPFIQELCEVAAKENNKILYKNKKSYTQYVKDWILQPKNVAKAGLVLGAIGGLYIFGPAVPAWLKEYTNKSVSSLVESVKNGTSVMINSVKNLWNRVRGNKELPDARESRMEAGATESDTDEYFAKKGRQDAQEVEIFKEVEDKIAARRQESLDREERFLERMIKEAREARLRMEEQDAGYTLLEAQKAQKAHALQEDQALKEYQRAGAMLNDIDTEDQLNAEARKQEQENATDFDKYHQEYQENLDTNTFESEKSRDRTMRNEGKEYFYNQMPESDAETLRFADTHLDDMITEGNPHNDTIRKQVYFELDKPYQDYYQRKNQAKNQERQRMFEQEQAQLAKERSTQETKKESTAQPEVPEIDTEFENERLQKH